MRELDTNFVIEKLKAIMQFVMPLDQGGVIDKNKLVKAAIEAIDQIRLKISLSILVRLLSCFIKIFNLILD